MLAKAISRVQTLSALLKERRAFARFIETLDRDPLARHRISGKWCTGDVSRYTALAAAVPGDYAEIGC